MNRDKLLNELIKDEGIRYKPYRDSVGKLTIGIGRNLDDVGLSYDEIIFLVRNDIEIALNDAQHFVGLGTFNTLTDARKRVLVNMAFNMGRSTLYKFKKFKQALLRGNYVEAAKEMLDSKWATQVGPRANRLAEMMKAG